MTKRGNYMNMGRHMIDVQHFEAKTIGNEFGQQKNNVIWSSFQQKPTGPTQSSFSTSAPRNRAEFDNQNFQKL